MREAGRFCDRPPTSDCVNEYENVAWASMPVSLMMVRDCEPSSTNMEETGVLVNLALLGLVLPGFEPGPKNCHLLPFVAICSRKTVTPVSTVPFLS